MSGVESNRSACHRTVVDVEDAGVAKAENPPRAIVGVVGVVVDNPPRPRLPSLSSLALPGPLSFPVTSALTSPSTSRPSSSTSSVGPDPLRVAPRPRLVVPLCSAPSTTNGTLNRSRFQAAMYEALRRRWSTSSASEVQTLAEAAAQALRKKQGARSDVAVVATSIGTGAAGERGGGGGGAATPATPAGGPLRAKRKSDALLEGNEDVDEQYPVPPTSSGMVIPCADEEACDQVPPLPPPLPPLASKRRRASFPAAPKSATRPPRFILDAHRSAIPSASRLQYRTFSLDVAAAGTEEGPSLTTVPSRETAFDNLLTSLAAVQTARSSLSCPFSTGPFHLL
ncbi:hypothetical protein JCM3774_004264 [Rhodotorula dairenensis]